MSLGPRVVGRSYQPPSVADEARDGSSSPSPDDIEQKPASPTPIASCHFTEEPETVERGRSLARGPRYPNPLARAESRIRRDKAAIEVDGGPILKRPRSVVSVSFARTVCRNAV